MKRYVGIVFIISALLHIVETHATVFATAVLRRGNNTVYLLSDMPDESGVAIKQREVLLERARDTKISIIADDCNDLEEAISALPHDARIGKRLAAEQRQVIDGVKSVGSLLPSLVTVGRTQGLYVTNMHYESTLLRDDIPVGDTRALIATLDKVVQAQSGYLMPADKQMLSEYSLVAKAITEQTKKENIVKDALRIYTAYAKFALAFKAAETLPDEESLIVCAAPEDVAFIANRLSRGGWMGDVSCVERLADDLTAIRNNWIMAREAAKQKLDEALKGAPKQPQGKKARRSSAQSSVTKLKKDFNNQWEKTHAQLRKQELTTIMTSKRYVPVDLEAFFRGISALRSLVSELSSAAQSSVPVGAEPKENEQGLLTDDSTNREDLTALQSAFDEKTSPEVQDQQAYDSSDMSPDDHAGKTQVEPLPATAQRVPVEEPGNVVVPTIEDAENLNEIDEADVSVQQNPMDADELTLVHVPSEDDSEDDNESTVRSSWFSANKAFVVGCGVTAAVVAGCVLAYQNGLFDGICKKLNSFGWF
jgi:hypothetical protein